MDARISWLGLLARLIAALAVVLLTYNPTGYSFYHWAVRDFANLTAVKAFFGALLLLGWVIWIRAAFTSWAQLGSFLAHSCSALWCGYSRITAFSILIVPLCCLGFY
jgi:hypothetical protein